MSTGRSYDKIAARYEDYKREAAPAGWAEELLSRWCELLPRAATVVDVGCGHGFEVERMRAQLGLVALGVDLSEGMLRLAQQRARGWLAQADATSLPLADESVNGVWSMHTLLHVLDLDAALAELHRVLRPSGLAALTLALGDGVTLEPVRFQQEVTRSFVHWSKEQVHAALEAAGFLTLDGGTDMSGRGTMWLLLQRP